MSVATLVSIFPGSSARSNALKGDLLLDSHSLLWLEAGAPIKESALRAIDAASLADALYISHMSIWELGVALRKKDAAKRPDLRGLTAGKWFDETRQRLQLNVAPISARIAMEAGDVPAVCGWGDPGDAFLIATARVQGLALVTRDAKIIELAQRRPDYIKVVPC